MNIILLERIGKLGQMGDVVSVKAGFARNYLLPQGKAMRATKDNKAHFETQRAQLEAVNLESKKEAETVAEKMKGEIFIAIRQAGDGGQLYGSVTPRDIATAASEGGFTVERSQVVLDMPIKLLGMHDVSVTLHPEVVVGIVMNVARSDEEAERQARGEDVTKLTDNFDDDDDINPEDVFDEDALSEGALDDLDEAVDAAAEDDGDSAASETNEDDVEKS